MTSFLIPRALGATAVFLLDGEPPPEVPPMPSYGSLLLETILALILVCALAYVVLKYGLKWLIPKEKSGLGAMKVVDRLPLDGRRTLYMVKIGKKVFLLAATDTSIRSVGEMDASNVEGLAEWEEALSQKSSKGAFKEVLARFMTRPQKNSPQNEKPPQEPSSSESKGEGDDKGGNTP